MEESLKKQAVRQYLHYFRFWFLAVGILALICLALCFLNKSRGGVPRANMEAPSRKVYDYADVLTEEEERHLAEYIAGREEKLQIDIVLLTISQPVEGEEAKRAYGLRYTDWERNMQDIADDFWDENHFGYNVGFEGDGVLLLYNWYEGQRGEVLSTSGKVEKALSSRDIERIFDAVDAYLDRDLYRAYQAYVDKVEDLLTSPGYSFPWAVVLILPTIAALFYAISGAKQSKAQNTVAVNAYVEGGKPVVNDEKDVFLRKSVVTRKIETSSSGDGHGGGSGGSGGHHHSSSGASHGGGSRRH